MVTRTTWTASFFVAIALQLGGGVGLAAAAPDPLTGEWTRGKQAHDAAAIAERSVQRLAVPGLGAPIPGALYATSGPALYTIDKETGASTLLGLHGAAIGTGSMVGIAFDLDSNLYGLTGAPAVLFKIDPDSGLALTVAPLALGTTTFEGGLAFSPAGKLFAVNLGNATVAKLWEINPQNGACTVVGPPQGEVRDLNALSFHGATLLAIEDFSSSLGEVDPATGEYTEIGPLGAEAGIVGGLARDPVDGQLYAALGSTAAHPPSSLYRIDPATGEGSFVADLTIPVYDMAFAPAPFFVGPFESGDFAGWFVVGN
jgi:hypothetical protein